MNTESGHLPLPRIRAQDMDQFFRDLRETILELENALESPAGISATHRAELAKRFGRRLARSYETAARLPKLPDPEGLRRKTVHALLNQTRDELFKIDTWFFAQIENGEEENPENSNQSAPLVAEEAGEGAETRDATSYSKVTSDSSNVDEYEGIGLFETPSDPSPIEDHPSDADVPNQQSLPEAREIEPTGLSESRLTREVVEADPVTGMTSMAGSNARESTVESPTSYIVRLESGNTIRLRLDQLLSARAWGVGFYFHDNQETDRVADLMARQAVEHLARDLLDLTRMLPRLLRGKPGQYPPLVPPRFSRAAEQLVADILNEYQQHAKLSRLSEDYLQKTDLRVRYSGLDRRRGARVQITLGPSQSQHQSKVETIRNPDHFVILSPWALACAIPHFGGDSGGKAIEMDHDLVQRFWQCLKGQPASLESLSYAIRAVLHDAIHAPIDDPRGPLARVPEAIRELIRRWVKHEAFRSTAALRAWEETEGEFFRRPDGRLSSRRLHSPKITGPLEKFFERFPPGTQVQGKVIAIGHKSATVQLPEDVVGRVSRGEVSWSTTHARLNLFLTIGQTVPLCVLGGLRNAPGVVNLSLKRTRPDPWLDPSVLSLSQRSVIMGKVQSRTPFGLFVELLPDVVGLLHRSTLQPEEQEKVWDLYPDSSQIPVSVQSMSIEDRRISLLWTMASGNQEADRPPAES